MGRSKFPGKPSKHVNKTRVNVLPCPINNITTSTLGDDCAVLAVSNKTGGDLEQNQSCDKSTKKTVSTTQREIDKRRRLTETTSGNVKTQSPIARKRVSKRYALKTGNAVHGKAKTLTTTTTTTTKYRDNDVSAMKTQKITRPCTVKVSRRLNTRRQIKSTTASEINSVVGKFVLPSRSLHSSRVIKPNKRFITLEQTCNPNRVDIRTFKKNRVLKKADGDAPSKDERKTSEPIVSKCPNASDNNVQRDDNNECTRTRTPCSNGRIVLRQARLQLHSQVSGGLGGPFSSHSVAPGTVTCGVCGAVRFYRFVKQARKFNIYSCESCRKFISKMIKRQTCSKSSLVCHKGLGMCHVPPIVRSQQWKLIRCAYRARCPACWLKMCLRSFQMPAALKSSLARLLPDNMQGPDSLFTTSLLTWQPASSNPETNPKSEQNAQKTRSTRSVQQPKTNPAPIGSGSVEVKRQKIDLKGPRVKHVCRSASIVLGQPLATFPNDQEKVVPERATDNCRGCVEAPAPSKPIANEVNEIELLPVLKKIPKVPAAEPQNNSSITNYFTTATVKKLPVHEPHNTISIDFWETYDPDEVCRSGLCLMSSEPFPMQAVCFLCGSAGKEALLHCSVCCEPYHSYCLAQDEVKRNSSFSWTCPRCTTCSACSQPDRQKINCQKCLKVYHPECFNTKWRTTTERPTMCSACLQCKSCGSDNIMKFVGNLPLCVMCFKLRKKGNFCPLCQGCYDENDFHSKMMECGQCSKWIHSKCEGLTDEQYQMLSILPETVEYLCCVCSSQSTPRWRKALDSELKASYHSVLRLLSKNQIVRGLLKWSPCTERTACGKPIGAVRKINFHDAENSRDSTYSSDSSQKDMQKKVECCNVYKEYLGCATKETQGIFNGHEKVSYPHTLSMVEIKNKVNSNEIQSLKEFNQYMECALGYMQSDTLRDIYYSILKEVFPWYDPLNNTDDDSCLNKSLLDSSQLEETIESSESSTVDEVINSSSVYRKKRIVDDTRMCALCKGHGDGSSVNESRLLFCGQNEWVHANCALWSSEVYEEIDGSLQNVHGALSRSRSIRCAYCKQKGASVGCCAKTCFESYHFICARKINCYFMQDKTLFCPTHLPDALGSVIVTAKDFDICRSVYVELDKKKKRYADPEKVYFMVGSLSVTHLGTIIPPVSDTADAIIPSGFTCSRLFWSTVEPWKLVSYVIKTSVLTNSTGSVHIDKNFTVDHSLPHQVVNRKLRELLLWQKEFEMESSCAENNSGDESDEEPQNTADLLPPELTDAILEEIPHDLLDGISMQDIFPKLMSYEDLLNMDLKATDFNGVNDYKDDSTCDSMDAKKKSENNDYDNKNRALKRSKSEVFSELANVDKLSKARSHQRSCSLTWSCKLDNSLSPTIKKRKIAPRETSMFVRLLQVDGGYDSSSGSECGYPLTVRNYKSKPTCNTAQADGSYNSKSGAMSNAERINETILSSSYRHDYCISSGDCECNSMYSKHQFLQLDGGCDSSSSSEYECDDLIQTFEEPPVQCKRCQCTYRTNASYKRHLGTCDAMSTSESDSECTNEQEHVITEQQTIDTAVNVITEQSTTHVSGEPYLVTSYESISTYQTTQNEVHSSFVNTQMVVKSSAEIPIATIPESQPVVYQSFQYPTETAATQQTFALPQSIQLQPSQPTVTFSADPTSMMNIASTPVVIDNASNVVVPQVQVQAAPVQRWVKPAPKINATAVNKSNRTRGRPPRSLAIKRNTQTGTLVLPQDNSSQTTVIMQHLANSNILPAYVDAFQQQTGQNLQYVATITPTVIPGMTSGPQFLQLQSDNGLVGLLSGMQPTLQIIQQPRVLTDQVLVDSSGSVMLTTQPVYYGFETIVQNTVMSSQQFVPTALPGILATNSSYSATTQVFQTSKIEPVLDVSPGSYVLLNSGQIVSSQSLQQAPSAISNNYQAPVQTTISQPHHQPPPQPPPSVSHIPVSVAMPNATWKVTADVAPLPVMSKTSAMSVTAPSTNSITLPVAPYVPEQGIPMNIVTPIPQVPPPQPPQVSRPMNRVLPMQTVTSREVNKSVPSPPDVKPDIAAKICEPEKLLDNIPEPIKPSMEEDSSADIVADKLEDAPLKLVFQKQQEEGIYKVNSRPSSKPKSSPIQIAPLKPMKPKEKESDNKFDDNRKDIQQNGKTVYVIAEPKIIADKLDVKTPTIMYTVESQDGFRFSSTSVCELWSKVLETVQEARAEHNMSPLPQNALTMMSDLQLLGLKTNGLRYLLEQLPGAARCIKYKPNFHTNNLSEEYDDDYLIEHSSGSIRCQPRAARAEPYDMFSWLASKHRKPEHSIILNDAAPRRASSVSLPMAMRFRQLKETSKMSVGVYRSNIHRRGLFCLRDIEAGEMVIEYAGEVIRSILTDKREKYYNSKGIGCYMFRIDDNLVVDATMNGNAARFINHSCDPNCYSRVLEILGHKHILIFALRRICRGEELTYDYKFPFEEDKIPCTCGAKRCRKFLN